MRLFPRFIAALLLAFGYFTLMGTHASAMTIDDLSRAARGVTSAWWDTTFGVLDAVNGVQDLTVATQNAVKKSVVSIRNSVNATSLSVGSAIDTQLYASANVFDSVRETVYCSITSFLRLSSCDEEETEDAGTGMANKSGGTATFIVGKTPEVRVQQNIPQPSRAVVVQTSIPSYVAPAERSGLSESQILTLIDRRMAAITPAQQIINNNYYETVVRGGDTVGFIQGPTEIREIETRIESLEDNSGASSQWTTSGSDIYYTTGNVGIGDSSPDYTLSVDGDANFTGPLNFSGDPGTSGFVLQSTGSTTPPVWVATSSLGISQWINNDSSIYYSAGNVGIGSTTPTDALGVAGNLNITGTIKLSGNSGTSGQILQSTGNTAPQWVATSSLGITSSQWVTSGSNIYYLNGGVAIGTTTFHGAALAVRGNIVALDDDGDDIAMIVGTTSTTGTGTGLTLRGGRSSATLDGGEIQISGGTALGGGGVQLTGAQGTNAGGAITINAGGSGSNAGAGATFEGANSSNGGNITLNGGSTGSGYGGSITLNGGSGSSNQRGHVVLQSSTVSGNVGVGTSTPLSARFTVVGAAGSLMPFLVASSSGNPLMTISHTGAVAFNNQAGASGSVLVSSGTTGSPTWVATSSLGIATSQWTTASVGTAIYYGLSGLGNVGIGTPVPGARLDVHTNVGGTGISSAIFNVSSSTTANLATSSLFTVYGNGQVAIGTTTVYTNDLLTVHGDVRLTHNFSNRDEVYIRAGTTTSGNGMNLRLRGGELVSNTGSEISLQGASSNSGGNIYINGGSGSIDNGGSINISAGGGNSGNGGANVNFSGATSGGGGEISFNSGNTSSGGTRGAPIKLNGGSGPCCGSNANRGFVLLQEFSHGQVGIGTSTPNATFSIKGSSLLTPVYISSSSDAVMFTILKSGNVGIGIEAPLYPLHAFRSDNGIVARFQDTNGTCDIDPTGSGTGLTCSSDQRLKKDIETLDSAEMLQQLSRVRPVTFRWNNQSDETLRFGVIAQELEQYFPEFVATDPQTGLKSVSYGSFIPVLIAGINDINTRLTTLEETMAWANQQVDSLAGPLRHLVLDTITATLGVFTKVQIEDGVELKDKATGQTYCLTIVAGEWAKTQGPCSTNVNIPNPNNNSGLPPPPPDNDDDDTGTSTTEVGSDDTASSTADTVIEVDETTADEEESVIEEETTGTLEVDDSVPVLQPAPESDNSSSDTETTSTDSDSGSDTSSEPQA